MTKSEAVALCVRAFNVASHQLTGKLQAGSPAEDGSYSVVRHTLVHPYILVAVQTAYNEVAPGQTPPAIQAQIYESPIQ